MASRLAVGLACLLAALPPLVFVALMLVVSVQSGFSCMLGDGWSFWSAAYLALHSRADLVFTPSAMGGWVARRTGCGAHFWSYPPTMLLLALPMGLLRPGTAVLLFDFLGIVCFAVAARLAGLRNGLWAAVVCSPVEIFNLASHQNGAWIAGLLIGGLALSETSPVLGGVLLGLASVKPQLWLLAPAFLAGRRNGLALAASLLTAAGLALSAGVAFSFRAWTLFVLQVAPAMRSFLDGAAAPGHSHMIVTVFGLARWAGLSVAWSNIVQLPFTLAGLAGAYWTARLPRLTPAERWACLGLLSVLVTPYLQNYDLFAATFGCGILLAGLLREAGAGLNRAEMAALAALWVVPGLTPWLALTPVPSLAPLLVIAVLAMAGRRMLLKSPQAGVIAV